MALKVPQSLKGKSPAYLYNALASTYVRASLNGYGKDVPVCSERPYGMKVCHGPEYDGIRHGSFHSTNLLCKWAKLNCSSGYFYSQMFTSGRSTYELRSVFFMPGQNEGSFGVEVFDGRDTQLLSQALDLWDDAIGDVMVLGVALVHACPMVDVFGTSQSTSQSQGYGKRSNYL